MIDRKRDRYVDMLASVHIVLVAFEIHNLG